MRRIFLMSLRRGTVYRGLKAGARQVSHHSQREPSASVIRSLCRLPSLNRPGRCQNARSMSDFRDSARTFTPDSSCDLDEGAVGRNLDHFTKVSGRCQASGVRLESSFPNSGRRLPWHRSGYSEENPRFSHSDRESGLDGWPFVHVPHPCSCQRPGFQFISESVA